MSKARTEKVKEHKGKAWKEEERRRAIKQGKGMEMTRDGYRAEEGNKEENYKIKGRERKRKKEKKLNKTANQKKKRGIKRKRIREITGGLSSLPFFRRSFPILSNLHFPTPI